MFSVRSRFLTGPKVATNTENKTRQFLSCLLAPVSVVGGLDDRPLLELGYRGRLEIKWGSLKWGWKNTWHVCSDNATINSDKARTCVPFDLFWVSNTSRCVMPSCVECPVLAGHSKSEADLWRPSLPVNLAADVAAFFAKWSRVSGFKQPQCVTWFYGPFWHAVQI